MDGLVAAYAQHAQHAAMPPPSTPAPPAPRPAMGFGAQLRCWRLLTVCTCRTKHTLCSQVALSPCMAPGDQGQGQPHRPRHVQRLLGHRLWLHLLAPGPRPVNHPGPHGPAAGGSCIFTVAQLHVSQFHMHTATGHGGCDCHDEHDQDAQRLPHRAHDCQPRAGHPCLWCGDLPHWKACRRAACGGAVPGAVWCAGLPSHGTAQIVDPVR